jgi:DNA-binding transcriptional ArsR family regulator
MHIEYFDHHRSEAGMEDDKAVAALSALAQPTRLTAFRALVQAGPNGLTAGDVADASSAQPSTMSHHLGMLGRASLVRSRRDGRSVVYAADYEGIRQLLAFLMEDCCQGRPEICGAGTSDIIQCQPKESC